MKLSRDLQDQVASAVLGNRLVDMDAELRRLVSDGRFG
jgi:hypothetical protein